MNNLSNLDSLVSAKNEFLQRFVNIISPKIYDIFKKLFDISQLNKKKRPISLKNFQLEIQKIKNWNEVHIERYILPIKNEYPYLADLITAIFISNIKILSSIRLRDSNKPVQVNIPNLNLFLHKIILLNAEHIFDYPEIMIQSKDSAEDIIKKIIVTSISSQIPLDKILSEYLEGVFNNDELKIPLKNFEERQTNTLLPDNNPIVDSPLIDSSPHLDENISIISSDDTSDSEESDDASGVSDDAEDAESEASEAGEGREQQFGNKDEEIKSIPFPEVKNIKLPNQKISFKEPIDTNNTNNTNNTNDSNDSNNSNKTNDSNDSNDVNNNN